MNSIQTIDNEPANNENSMTYADGSDQTLDDGLSYRERLFVDAYTGEAKGNATKAAQLSGYGSTYDSQRQAGSTLLTKPHIRACVRARAMAVMSEHEVITQLATIARRECSDIAMNARVKAIELLMKFHGMVTEKVQHSGTVEQQVKQVIVHVNATSIDQETKNKQ